jgi:hypothetical protein
LDISEEQLSKSLKSFPPDSAGGIDGLRPQFLKDMLLAAPDQNTQTMLLQPLRDLSNRILKGELPMFIRPLFLEPD